MAEPDTLVAPNTIEYPFRRTTGPVIGAFLTALREGFLVGIRGSDGRVIVPPVEYDPYTSETLVELVEVGDAGEVTAWSWVSEPLEGQPLDRPFAFALIKLDGADTAMLHAVDTGGDPAAMATGMRVKARWKPARPQGASEEEDPSAAHHRVGSILDIESFVPEGDA